MDMEYNIRLYPPCIHMKNEIFLINLGEICHFMLQRNLMCQHHHHVEPKVPSVTWKMVPKIQRGSFLIPAGICSQHNEVGTII